MAVALIGGALLGDLVSKISSGIIVAINKTRHFKSQLNEMKETINLMKPILEDIEKLNKILDQREEETKVFIDLLKRADELVQKCEHIKIQKRISHASKLDDLNKKVFKLVVIHLQLQNTRDTKKILLLFEGLKMGSSDKASSSGVPLLKGKVIGFDDRVRDLKAMLLKDSPDGDCSVVAVSADAGGFGKTTFVKLFCNDPQVKERFGRNIYFVTVSQTYDPKVIVKKLLGELPSDTDNEDAIQQWGRFLGDHIESEILLVLDDVWSDKVITDFKFKLPRYKILVTSRTNFRQFKTYHLKGLNNQDATDLFRYSAFQEPSNNIPDELVDKLVKCCKNHPLALSVIGGMLNGAHLACWKLMLKQLSEEKKSLLDLNESILECLKRSLSVFDDQEPEMKECYQHLGLFPEDQKIAATALMDIWAHLYNHDEEGLKTMKIFDMLSSRNLATLLPKRKHSYVTANDCEEEFVTQHDMLKELAIRSTSEEPIERRETLIVNAYGQDLPQLPQTVNARVFSISTGKRFSLTWNEIQAPEVEVFVLNFMSEAHPLPQFMHKMDKLKVLIITNYGYYFSEIQNFPEPQYLSGLTRIRLDHVSISSISTKILMLENLQKLSLIMCKIGNSFDEGVPNKLTNLFEIQIESCDDLVTFPATLCNLVHLKKLSITNCHELTSFSTEIGNLSNLEVLRIASCSKLTSLPESVRNLKKLKIIDISNCLNMHELPRHIGELDSLDTVDATGCTGLHELPKSVKDFDKLEVVCDEETSHLWSDFKNVKVKVVEEDRLDAFFKILPRGYA